MMHNAKHLERVFSLAFRTQWILVTCHPFHPICDNAEPIAWQLPTGILLQALKDAFFFQARQLNLFDQLTWFLFFANAALTIASTAD